MMKRESRRRLKVTGVKGRLSKLTVFTFIWRVLYIEKRLTDIVYRLFNLEYVFFKICYFIYEVYFLFFLKMKIKTFKSFR